VSTKPPHPSPKIRIRLRTSGPSPVESAVYRVAGATLVVDVPMVDLAPFASGTLDSATAPRPTATSSDPDKTVYRGPGLVGGELRTVTCRRRGNAFEIDLPDIAQIAVATDGSAATILDTDLALDSELLAEAVLGPGLILALALNGTFCLHASAVITPGGDAIAILGEYGRGKSTLARFLDVSPDTELQRVGDDILPVRLSEDGLVALPHFPQLKLPGEAQYPPSSQEQLPLRDLYVLGPFLEPEAAPEVAPLNPRDATLALLRHSVAARLFDGDLKAAHLEWCAGVTRHTTARRLALPCSVARLDEAAQAVGAG